MIFEKQGGVKAPAPLYERCLYARLLGSTVFSSNVIFMLLNGTETFVVDVSKDRLTSMIRGVAIEGAGSHTTPIFSLYQ